MNLANINLMLEKKKHFIEFLFFFTFIFINIINIMLFINIYEILLQKIIYMTFFLKKKELFLFNFKQNHNITF